MKKYFLLLLPLLFLSGCGQTQPEITVSDIQICNAMGFQYNPDVKACNFEMKVVAVPIKGSENKKDISISEALQFIIDSEHLQFVEEVTLPASTTPAHLTR